MNIPELVRRITLTHTVELADLRQGFSGAEQGSAGRNQDDRRVARIGPVRSIEDRDANLTIVADIADLAWFTADPTLRGNCISVAIAGHSRLTGISMPLPPSECDAWARAILGDVLMAHAYRSAGANRSARHRSVLYRIFLDERHNPVPKPEAVNDSTLNPCVKM